MSALVDTSCLLRLPVVEDTRRTATIQAMAKMTQQGETLTVAQQNFVEFRGVATRPVDVGGLGMTPAQAGVVLDGLESQFPVLQETVEVYETWRWLCDHVGVSGKQVHDTRLVAFCIVWNIGTVLTWNPKDFRRFVPHVKGLTVYTPEDVLKLP